MTSTTSTIEKCETPETTEALGIIAEILTLSSSRNLFDASEISDALTKVNALTDSSAVASLISDALKLGKDEANLPADGVMDTLLDIRNELTRS